MDDQTVEYTLEKPTPYFLKQLSFPCFFPVNGEFMAEQGEMFGLDKETTLYCGAYLLTSFERARDGSQSGLLEQGHHLHRPFKL